MVEKWPHSITEDTTFYACTEKMAAVRLYNADGSDFEGVTDAYILEDPKDDASVALQDRYGSGAGYTQLTTLILPTTLSSVGSYAFKGTPVRNLVFHRNVTLATCAFYENTALESVTIPGGTIGNDAFGRCANLKNVSLGEGVTSIGSYAFRYCTSLTSLSIPDSVTSYGAGMIQGCSALKSLRVGAGIGSSVGPWESSSTSTPTNPLYIGEDNQLETLELAEGITSIGSAALSNNSRHEVGAGYTHLTTLILPTTLSSVGSYAFNGTPVCKLVFKGEVTLASSAFGGNTALESVTIPGGTIGAGAFSGCTNLKTVTLGDGVTSIGSYAFKDCTSLTSLSIPDSVTEYGGGMIEGCTGLRNLRVGAGIGTTVGPWPSTGRITNPLYIGEDNQLETLELAEGITSIGYYALANHTDSTKGLGYKHLRMLILPTTVSSVERYAFNGTPVRNLVFKGEVALAANAFYGNTALESVTMAGGTIGDYAFRRCTNLKTVTLGEGVTSIGYCAFEGCTSLTALSILDSVTSYGGSMIEGCTALDAEHHAASGFDLVREDSRARRGGLCHAGRKRRSHAVPALCAPGRQCAARAGNGSRKGACRVQRLVYGCAVPVACGGQDGSRAGNHPLRRLHPANPYCVRRQPRSRGHGGRGAAGRFLSLLRDVPDAQ